MVFVLNIIIIIIIIIIFHYIIILNAICSICYGNAMHFISPYAFVVCVCVCLCV